MRKTELPPHGWSISRTSRVVDLQLHLLFELLHHLFDDLLSQHPRVRIHAMQGIVDVATMYGYVLKQRLIEAGEEKTGAKRMTFFFEERPSDSPFIERIWHAYSEQGRTFTSIAEAHSE